MILVEDTDHARTFELPGNGFLTPAAIKEMSITAASKAQLPFNDGPPVLIGRRFITGLTMLPLILLVRLVVKRSRIIRKESLCLSR